MTFVLVIAGCDSSGGAGIGRDIATLAQLGVGARCAVTAITAQTHTAVRTVHALPASLVTAQIEAAFASGSVGAIKVGMLATAPIVRAVSQALAPHRDLPLVLDPVLAASSGGELLDASGRAALITHLLPQVALLTPNLPEAAALLGAPQAHTEDAMRLQAHALRALGPQAVLLKGGHAGLAQAVDVLALGDGRSERFAAARQPRSRRGSGCALAAALAAALARGLDVSRACAEAKQYVSALFNSID